MRSWVAGVVLCGALATMLAACATVSRDPVPAAFENDAVVAGMGPTQIRYWGDQLPPNADALIQEKWAQVHASRPQRMGKGRPVVNSLALSGEAATAPLGQDSLAAGPRPANGQNSTLSPESAPAR